jgi:hypothetical protein
MDVSFLVKPQYIKWCEVGLLYLTYNPIMVTGQYGRYRRSNPYIPTTLFITFIIFFFFYFLEIGHLSSISPSDHNRVVIII